MGRQRAGQRTRHCDGRQGEGRRGREGAQRERLRSRGGRAGEVSGEVSGQGRRGRTRRPTAAGPRLRLQRGMQRLLQLVALQRRVEREGQRRRERRLSAQRSACACSSSSSRSSCRSVRRQLHMAVRERRRGEITKGRHAARCLPDSAEPLSPSVVSSSCSAETTILLSPAQPLPCSARRLQQEREEASPHPLVRVSLTHSRRPV